MSAADVTAPNNFNASFDDDFIWSGNADSANFSVIVPAQPQTGAYHTIIWRFTDETGAETALQTARFLGVAQTVSDLSTNVSALSDGLLTLNVTIMYGATHFVVICSVCIVIDFLTT
jgi:hypothetical protein